MDVILAVVNAVRRMFGLKPLGGGGGPKEPA
jgi:hypothetical protein